MPKKQSNEELEKRVEDLEKVKSDLQSVVHASEQKFTALIQNIEDGYYEVDIAGNFIFFNDSLCKILGYSKKELTGLNSRRYMDEENAKIVYNTFNRVYKTGQPYKAFDWELIRKDGSKCYIEASVTLKRDSNGQPIGFQGIARDITERKRAEAELLREQHFSEKLINQLPGSFYMFPESGRMMRWNDNLEKVTGYSGSEIQQMNALDFFAEDEREKVYQGIQEVFVTGASQVEANFLHKKGNKIPHVLTGSKVAYDSVPYLLGVGLDITEGKQAEVALKESEERFRQIAESIREVFWLFDWQEQRVLYVNPAYELIWGRSREALMERYDDWGESIHPDDVSHAQETFNRILETGGGEPREYRIVRPDGSERWISDTGYTIKDRDGKVVRIAGIAEDITDRKMAEEARRTIVLQWKTTFDSVNDSICILGPDWRIEQANKATSDIFKIPMAKIVGRKCYELVHGTSAPIDGCPVRRVMETHKREVEEFKIDDQWFEITADPIIGDEGALKGIVHIISDISERKKSEVALKQSEETLRSIFTAAPTGIGMVCNRIITQANDRLCEMIGRSREELLNKGARIFYPTDEDYEYVGQVKYDQIKEKGTGTVETRWQHKNGDILDILLSSTPINVEDWSQGVTFTALDITKRKQTEKKLYASHEMFLTVLDSIDATIYVADMDTYEILFMNKHMIESFGGDLTGKICWDVFRDGAAPCGHCTNSRLVDIDGKPTGVYVWQDKNPITGKWYINHDRAIKWVDDRLVRIQIATDTTRIKQLERQLQQSQKMEAIGNLAGGIAHDFNNILSAVIGYSELSMQDVEKTTQLENNLIEIHKAGLRARNLVKQILTFARQADRDLKPIKLTTIAKEILSLLRSTLPASIEIKSFFESESLVMADATQIHQIFMNLCTNAAQAMKKNGGILEIGLSDIEWTGEDTDNALQMEPGVYTKVTIADTGMGISAQNLQLIFEPYFTTKKTGEGTGLGLSVVHGIVKGYGGEILAESELGHGTVLTIYLPTIKKGIEKIPPAVKALQKGNERVLFVDDELPICEIGSQILERLGYSVTTKSSSVEALALFRSNPYDFDLVITDMTMPQLNGDKLASELMVIRPDIPIILCTGYSQTMSSDKAAGMGIRAFAMKPLTVDDLAKTVRKVLDIVKK